MTAIDVSAVHDNPDRHRFLVTLDGHEAELVYRRDDDRLVLIHTGVPDELGGRGVGSALVRAAVEVAKRDSLTIVPDCPFTRSLLVGHPEVAELVTIDWSTTS